MAQKILTLFLFFAMLLIFLAVSNDNYEKIKISKYGTIVNAIVAGRSCPGKSSEIYVTYNNERYPIWVSYLNCINDFPDGSEIKVRYLEGYGFLSPQDNTMAWAIVMESTIFILLVMIAVSIYQAFFPKKAEEEN